MNHCMNVRDWSNKFDARLKLSLSELFWIEQVIEEIWDEGFDNGQKERSENDYEQGYKDGRRDSD